MGYTGVEVFGRCGWMKHEGGWLGSKNQKLSCKGLVLASEVWADLFLGREDAIGVWHTGVKYWEGAIG